MRHMRTWGLLAVTLVTAAGLAGCTSTPAPKPVTLTIGTDDLPGVPGVTQIEDFARHVKELSHGALTIAPKLHAAGDVRDWDQAVAKIMIDGGLDMALIPSRAWDKLGVTSLEPLSAPFVITTEQALDDVIAQEGSSLMSGLPAIGVEGIALFPEGLRRLFGFDNPILSADVLAGYVVRGPTSATSAQVFETLGATMNDAEPDPSKHVARESSFLYTPGGAGPATGNITLYPKANTLVIGKKSADKLTKDQRAILDHAAAATLKDVLRTQPTDVKAAQKFCADGGTIVNAPDAEVAKFRAATAPVIASIAAQGDNAERMKRIQAIAKKALPAPVAACVTAVTQAVGDQSLINGVYRYSMTPEDYRAHGVTDQHFIDNNIGVMTMTMQDGKWTADQTGPLVDHNTGKYWLTGDNTFGFQWPGEPPEAYAYTRDADGSLHLTVIKAEYKAGVSFTLKKWERVG